MGHIANNEREYRLLQQRLDKNITGAPYSPVFIKILKLLFTPQEAGIARQIPLLPVPVSKLAEKVGLPEDELYAKVLRMAERGLVFDFEHNGQCHVVLAPVVIGFFEFVFMRTRDDLPLGELAALFEEYMFKDDRFARDVFQESTQLGRTLVQEEAVPAQDYSEVLDWEMATSIIKSAANVGVSLCACRHKAEHLGKACGAPQRTCLTFNKGADMLIKKGIAEQSSVKEALRIIEECKAAGLMQIADNVQSTVGFMCNCCGCCCGMLSAMKTFNLKNAVVTSNWLAAIHAESCNGCGLCVKKCPVGAIHAKPSESGTSRRVASLETDLCLGCGLCSLACRRGAITMTGREQRVMVPETTFDRMVSMAIERGKLSNFLFSDPTRVTHRALGRVASIVENSAPVKGLLAIKSVRSSFLSAIVSKAKSYQHNNTVEKKEGDNNVFR